MYHQISHSVSETSNYFTPLTASGEYMYCYCKEDRGGEMIGCDNSDCLHGKRFHFKLKSADQFFYDIWQ